MAVNPSSLGGPKPQFELSDGLPAVGNKLFWYVSGSVGTKQNTYTDSTGNTANTNPVVLNSLGMPTTEIWLTAGQLYTCVYAPATDTDPPTSPIFTINGIAGINDTTVSQDQWVAGPTPTYIGATSFSLVGDQTGTFQVGRRVKTTNTGGTIYSRISASVFGAVTTVTVVNDSGTLDSGLSAVSYGLLSALNQSIPNINGVPIGDTSASTGSFTTLAASGNTTLAGDLAVNGGDLTSTATTFNLLNSTVTTLNAFAAATSVSLGADAGNFTVRGILSGTFKPRVNNSYTPGDTTPSVLDSGILSISNAGPVTITQFDDGVTGQLIYLIFEDANTTINRANCVLAGGVNFTSSANDILVLIKTATVWAEVCRSVNS